MGGPFWWSSFTLSLCLSSSDKWLKRLREDGAASCLPYADAIRCLKADL
jgi:hypothetical protein